MERVHSVNLRKAMARVNTHVADLPWLSMAHQRSASIPWLSSLLQEHATADGMAAREEGGEEGRRAISQREVVVVPGGHISM